MKKSLVNKYLTILLLVLIVALTAVGCEPNNDGGNALDKTALNTEIALQVTEQGDFTADSYNAYVAKFANAKQIANSESATQQQIDDATAQLAAARLALAIRPIELVAGANKQLQLNSGESKEIVISQYINTNDLSKITYKALTSNEVISLGTIADGKFTITAGQVNGKMDVTVSINVYYDNVAKRTVDLCVTVINEVAPTLLSEEFTKQIDVITLGNATSLTLDFAENVQNLGNLALTYCAKHGQEDLELAGSLYTFTLGAYTEETTYETFVVTISCTVNGKVVTLEYTYTLGLKDNSKFTLTNGSFENGLEDWTVVGNIGNVSSDTHYWLNDSENANGYAFGMDGEKMFSGYAPGAQESAVGTLTSSTFKLSGAGWVTFKVGAMRDGNYVYVDVVDANTKQILARYYNGLWADRTDGAKSGCSLVAYKADLSAFIGKDLFFRISDNADSGYGLFFADSFITYYESEPVGFNVATPVNYQVSGTIYDLFNGGFELGDVQGWWNNGEPGKVTGANKFFDNIEYGKHGNFLYSGAENWNDETNAKAGDGREGNTGVLTSSTFQLGGTGFISFMLGGGNDFCYVQVIDSTTGQVLARYRQQQRDFAVLKTYIADLSAHIGKTVRIQLVDNATRDWGCVSFDNVVTYYVTADQLPTGAIVAVDTKHSIVNGSFETGTLDGWKMNIWEAGTHNTLGWVLDTEVNSEWYTKNEGRKDGNHLFTFWHNDDRNAENTKGTLESSVFTLKANSFVSFKFGGAGTREVRIELVRADGTVIATFFNEVPGKVNTEMHAYYYEYTGETADCFFRVVDNSTSNYGCFVVDDFRVNLDTAPEGFLQAIQG